MNTNEVDKMIEKDVIDDELKNILSAYKLLIDLHNNKKSPLTKKDLYGILLLLDLGCQKLTLRGRISEGEWKKLRNSRLASAP